MRNLLKAGLRRFATPSTTPATPRRALGDREATVLAVAAQKGGVGKTTTCVNLGAALARSHGKKVLVVDLDPQGHVHTALRTQLRPGGGLLSQVLVDETGGREVVDIVADTAIGGLHVTPVDPGLAQAEDLLGTRIGKEYVLRDALRATRTHYDYILVDCPPNLGNLTLNGLVAADQVLIPCDPSPLALHGVDALVRTVSTIAARLNPDIDVLGVLLTRVDGRNKSLNDAIVGQIHAQWDDALLPVTIGISSSLAKAQMAGRDIYDFDPECRGAAQYEDLARLVVESA
jgi:chromosome partitioning protein